MVLIYNESLPEGINLKKRSICCVRLALQKRNISPVAALMHTADGVMPVRREERRILGGGSNLTLTRVRCLRDAGFTPLNAKCHDLFPGFLPSSVSLLPVFLLRGREEVFHSGGGSYLQGRGGSVYLTPWADPLFPPWPLTLGQDFLQQSYQPEAQRWNTPIKKSRSRKKKKVRLKNEEVDKEF